jgi:tRNA A-37 threonylcarbamoyl transferase component Bud32
MEAAANKPTVQMLFFREGGDVETLVDCGGFRYHLAVQYNDADESCQENVLLKTVWDALEAQDDAAVTEARDACMELVWPLMLADYARRVESNQSPTNGTIKLRAVTKHGQVFRTDHELHLEYPPTKPVKNEYPGIKTVPSAEIEKQEEIEDGILKVKVRDEQYCLKSVHRKFSVRCFEREIKILQECSHSNIVRLISLVADAHDNVEGMLLEYIANGRKLSSVMSLTSDQYERWTKQIREAITYLHTKNLIWGDAKPGNILVRENDTILLIDFGGGYTEGWVDDMNFETVQGDLQGYERIVEFLKANIENK